MSEAAGDMRIRATLQRGDLKLPASPCADQSAGWLPLLTYLVNGEVQLGQRVALMGMLV